MGVKISTSVNTEYVLPTSPEPYMMANKIHSSNVPFRCLNSIEIL